MRLRNPFDAALAYWRKEIGVLHVRDVTPSPLAAHRDRLLGAPTRSHGHKSTKAHAGRGTALLVDAGRRVQDRRLGAAMVRAKPAAGRRHAITETTESIRKDRGFLISRSLLDQKNTNRIRCTPRKLSTESEK